MLKINASYSKKVPAEIEYSSQSYHCQIESELPDGLTHEQLQARIHETFALVKQAVEAELHGVQESVPNTATASPLAPPTPQLPAATHQPANPVTPPQQAAQNYQRNKQHTRTYTPASAKQIDYLLNLAKRIGWSRQDIVNHCQVNRLEEIDKLTCSHLIEQFAGRAA